MHELMGTSLAALETLRGVLLHSLWQGALVTFLVYVALRRAPAARSRLRYGISATGLLALVAAAFVTWCVLGIPESANVSRPPIESTRVEPRAVSPATGHPDTTQPANTSAPQPIAAAALEAHTLPNILLACWLVGVLLMMVRVFRLMSGARGLRLQSQALDDPLLTTMLSELKELLGISRRVALLVADELATPVAMGLFWPAVIVPATMATGLQPEQLRAVLAHELAHIRRYDYLVNFFQLVVEALLYFNPAVWWLSRQVRIEREACCDAAAARALGPGDYAEALTQVARYVHTNTLTASAAQAFGATAHQGGTLDRLRRLLSPGYRPHLRLRWYSVAAGFLVSLAFLFGLYQSSALSVAFAGWFLSDEERIEAMADLAETYESSRGDSSHPREKVAINGTITTHDGKPLPDGKWRVKGSTRAGNAVIGEGLYLDGNRFHGSITKGETRLSAEVPGYAPTMLGPLWGENEESLKDLKLHLGPSDPVTIRFVAPDGKAVEGAEVTGGYKYVESSWSGTLHMVSDAEGAVTFDQAQIPIPVTLRVNADGFQQAQNKDLLIQPGGTFEWLLQPDKPLEGHVVDRETGAPIADAEIAFVYEPSRGWAGDTEGKPVTSTDANGTFTLRGLADGRRYYFLVHAQGYGSELVLIDSGQTEPLRVALGPRYVRGIVRGDLDLLKRSKEGDAPVIEYAMDLSLPAEHHTHGGHTKDCAVAIENGEGRFRIDALRAGELVLQAGPKTLKLAVQDSIEDLVIDLNEEDAKRKRKVVFNLLAPDNAPPASGQIGISVLDAIDNYYHGPEPIEVRDGRAETEVEAPTKMRVSVDGLNGYLARAQVKTESGHPATRWEIAADEDPFVIDLPLERAGAIHGRVLLPDGQPAAEARVYVSSKPNPEPMWPNHYLCHTRQNVDCDKDGRFAVLPVPLDRTFEIRASIGFARAEEKVKVRASRPIANVELTIPKGIDVPVLVLDAEGRPVPDTALKVHYPGGGHTGLRTGPDGRYILRNAAPRKGFYVKAQPSEHYQFTRVPVPFDGKELVIHLREKGLRASGVVQNAETGKPVPNMLVKANAAYVPGKEYHSYEVETLTNAEGVFEFTNLCEGEFRISAESHQSGLQSLDPDQRFTAGQTEPIVIKVQLK